MHCLVGSSLGFEKASVCHYKFTRWIVWTTPVTRFISLDLFLYLSWYWFSPCISLSCPHSSLCNWCIYFYFFLFHSFRVPIPIHHRFALGPCLMEAQSETSGKTTQTCTSTWWNTIKLEFRMHWSASRLGRAGIFSFLAWSKRLFLSDIMLIFLCIYTEANICAFLFYTVNWMLSYMMRLCSTIWRGVMMAVS